jgi:hypothetical protein
MHIDELVVYILELHISSSVWDVSLALLYLYPSMAYMLLYTVKLNVKKIYKVMMVFSCFSFLTHLHLMEVIASDRAMYVTQLIYSKIYILWNMIFETYWNTGSRGPMFYGIFS